MNRTRLTLTFLFAVMASAAAYGQHGTESAAPSRSQTSAPTQPQTNSRDANREKLRAVLESAGPKINVSFRQSDKQPFNFVGVLKTGLTNADALEIVILVGDEDTIHFRIFPHYKGAYLNIDKASNGGGLMRQMVSFTDKNFLFWGADSSGDIFAGFNFTLESGFPEASIRVVLNSISKLDVFVGQMRPSIDGSAAP
jgi:hypothetical protein